MKINKFEGKLYFFYKKKVGTIKHILKIIFENKNNNKYKFKYTANC